ncbi:hypothetical protein ACIBSV_10005 [Embleya sp. NPDC050154]|uniref:hypothetical protein n=1 Tax=unclassified Embleya TaxID=2699296 RepID=UPI0037A244D1
MDALLLVAVSVALVGVIGLLVVLSFGRREGDSGSRDLLRVGEDAGNDPVAAGNRASGSTAWMRGGGGGL